MILTKTNLIKEISYHFCRLSGISLATYKKMLFDYDYNYTQTYCQKNSVFNWKKDSVLLLLYSLFWNWCKITWSLKINELIKDYEINTNLVNPDNDESLFLSVGFEVFKNFSLPDWDCLNPNIPNQLNIKVYEKQSLAPCPPWKRKDIGKESDIKNNSSKTRNTNFRKQRRPIA